MTALKIAGLEVRPGEQAKALLHVTRTLRGDLNIPVHVAPAPGKILAA